MLPRVTVAARNAGTGGTLARAAPAAAVRDARLPRPKLPQPSVLHKLMHVLQREHLAARREQ